MDASRAFVFSTVAIVVYTLAEYFNLPLLPYHLPGGFFPTAVLAQGRRVILWYGWIAIAIVVGLAFAVITPERIRARLGGDTSWIALIIAMVAVLIYEKRWFF